MLGKEVRMNRLFRNSSGNILVIALDHAVGWGVLEGIDDIKRAMELVVEGEPDAITMLKGTAEKVFRPYAGVLPFILKCTTFAPYHPMYDTLVSDVDEAIAMGADAIACGATVAHEGQSELLSSLAKITKDAAKAGLPTVTHIYPKGVGKNKQHEEEYVSYAARAAFELNVDIIKTFYTGDPVSYSKVIKCCPEPAKVVVSGGPKSSSVRDVFQMTFDAMNVGAKGVTYGRNVWQAEDPVSMIKALKHIVHNKGTVEEAMEIAKIK